MKEEEYLKNLKAAEASLAAGRRLAPEELIHLLAEILSRAPTRRDQGYRDA